MAIQRTRSMRFPRFAWIAAAIVVAGVALAILRPWPHGAPRVRALAVLPLDNVSGDSSEEYYADGMTEELILELSKISALRVISRTSVMSLKGRDLPLSEVGRRLDVDAVIEGTVARRDGRLRVSLQLFRVEPEGQLWAERYDRPADRALELQSEIARAVVGPVQVQMTPAEARRLRPARSIDPAAHEAYLRGRYSLGQLDSTHMSEALRQFNRAVLIDPQYSSAWAGLARNVLPDVQHLPASVVRDGASPGRRTPGARARSRVRRRSRSHRSVLSQYDWKFKEAETEFREGLRFDPSNSDCHFDLAYMLLETGARARGAEGIRDCTRARSARPRTSQLLRLRELLRARTSETRERAIVRSRKRRPPTRVPATPSR
jgi:TolB-like protein